MIPHSLPSKIDVAPVVVDSCNCSCCPWRKRTPKPVSDPPTPPIRTLARKTSSAGSVVSSRVALQSPETITTSATATGSSMDDRITKAHQDLRNMDEKIQALDKIYHDVTIQIHDRPFISTQRTYTTIDLNQ